MILSASGKIQLELVNITPTPIFARLGGPHDGMLGRVEVLGRMLILGRIAATNMSAA